MGRKYDFELLLVRHGDAEDWAEGGDAQRALTARGAEALRRCVPAWRHLDWHWSAALTSPFVRARQTGAIFYEALAPGLLEREHTELPAPMELDEIIPSGNPQAAARQICEVGHKLAGPRPRVAVFAHNPILSRLTSLFLSGDDAANISFGRGDVVHLFIPAPSPFDMIVDPVEQEPLPRAVLLGFYPRAQIELMAAGVEGG